MSETPMRRRRELLKLAPLLLLGGFASPSWRDAWVAAGLEWSDRASSLLFRERHLAPTFRDDQVVPLDRFPYNFYDVVEPEIDFANWALQVGGRVSRPGAYTLDRIRSLPVVRQNTRHVCVEGWDVIGRFGGATIADVLTFIGADPSARYITVTCADGYYESLDIETARHPQSLLCYEMYDRPLDRGHGAPLRLLLPTKLGYKSAKYLMTLEVTATLPERAAYWSDQGYSWYAGL